MAKIFEHSEDADVKQLSIFETPATNMSITDRRYLNYHPVSGITANTNVIHFSIKGNSLKYLDLLNSRLYVRCKIRDADNRAPVTYVPRKKESENPDDNVSMDLPTPKKESNKNVEVVFPINHLLQSMWKQVEVYLGGKLVSSGSTNFHYKSIIKTLIYLLSSEGKKRALMSEMFFEDSPGGHDKLDSIEVPNTGAYKRKLFTQNGATFEMEGTLNEDVMKLKKYLINGVDFDLKLYPARSAFLLMAKNGKRKEYNIVIEDCLFKACTADVGGSIISAHNQSLAKGAMAQYFFEQTQLNNYAIAAGQRNFSQTVFQGKIPHRVVVAMVSAQRYNGDYELNPFFFHHFNATNMSVLVNDVSTPHRPLEMNFEKGQFASPLFNLIRTRSNVVIDAESFDRGYSLFLFDINPKINSYELPLQTSGNVRLEMQFANQLEESVQVLVYGEFESCIQINNERAVYYTPL